MAKQPSFQFYPGDWLKDPALQKCTASAIGAFINLLCYAFECEPRGYWITNGRPWTIQEMANMVKVKSKMVRQLVDKGVIKFSTDLGAYFSKRMVEDERIRAARAVSGSKGGKQTASKRLAKPKQTGSSSSSSSSSSSTSVGPPSPPRGKPVSKPKPKPADWSEASKYLMGGDTLDSTDFRHAWCRWAVYRTEIKKALTASTVKAQILKLVAWGTPRAVAAIDHTIERGWTGLREPDQQKGDDPGWFERDMKKAL